MKKFILLIALLLLSSCKNSLPPVSTSCDYDKIADKITAATAKKIERETSLRPCGAGGGSENNHLRKLNMSFHCFKEINIDHGRQLITYCVNEYLAAINSNEEIRSSLIHFPFTPNDVEIHIFIRQPDNRDVPPGNLSIVSEREGKVAYKVFESDPFTLKRIHEETFEEAMRLVASHKELKNN